MEWRRRCRVPDTSERHGPAGSPRCASPPVLISDPPLLNVQGVHQPYTPRLVVEVVTADGVTGLGETYGDTKYLELARPYAAALIGHDIADLNGLFTLVNKIEVDGSRVDASVDVGGLRGVQTADKLRLSVVSAFEVACLDALGKIQGVPVHTLLGGKVRDSVEYSAYLFYRWAEHPGDAGREGRLGRGAGPGRDRRAGPPLRTRARLSLLQAQGRCLPARAGGRRGPRPGRGLPRPPAPARPQRRLDPANLAAGRRRTRGRTRIPGGPGAGHARDGRGVTGHGGPARHQHVRDDVPGDQGGVL